MGFLLFPGHSWRIPWLTSARSRLRAMILQAALATSLLMAGGQCLAAPPSEATIKAAFMANMVQFTDWPDKFAPTGKVNICVTGRGPTVDALLALDGQPAYGRSLSVSFRKRPSEALDCHLLFIAENNNRPAYEWLHELAEHPILTVGEADDFALSGGIVGLFRDGNRVTFDVSLPAMHRANLKISAQLLRLARQTHSR